MIATPHFYADRQRVDDFLYRREKAFDALRESQRYAGPSLLLGAEVAFFKGISEAERLDDLTVEGTRVLLLEMPFRAWSSSDIREVRELSVNRGYQIVLAHLERYMGISENKKRISELLELPVHVQINAESLLDWKSRRKLIKMFGGNQAHFLGSDCHGLHHRKPNLGEGRAVLQKKLGDAFLKQMDERATSLLQLGGRKYV